MGKVDSFYFYEKNFLTSKQLTKSIDLTIYENLLKHNLFQKIDSNSFFDVSYLNIISKELFILLAQVYKNYNFFFCSFLIIWDLVSVSNFFFLSNLRFYYRLHYLNNTSLYSNIYTYYKFTAIKKNNLNFYISNYFDLFKRYPFKQFNLLFLLLEIRHNSLFHTWDPERVKKFVLDFIEKHISLPKKALSFYSKQMRIVRYSQQKIFIKKK